MASLPTTTVAFASGATEAQFKTFLSDQRAYLAGLFGTDGTAATAKVTLGIVSGVSSVNGNTGAVTAAQISSAATAGYGYTPANNASLASYSPVGHTHAYTPTDVGAGGIGSFVLGYRSTGAASAGTTITGTSLKDASGAGGYSGTWRVISMGGIGTIANLVDVGIVQRIA